MPPLLPLRQWWDEVLVCSFRGVLFPKTQTKHQTYFFLIQSKSSILPLKHVSQPGLIVLKTSHVKLLKNEVHFIGQ